MKNCWHLMAVALAATFLLVYGLSAPAPRIAPSRPAAQGLALPRARGRARGRHPGSARAAASPPPTATAEAAPTSVATEATATPQPSATPSPTVTPTPTFVAPALIKDRPLRIFIDAGHGGPDAGAVHVEAAEQVDLLEKDVDLDISLRLAALLRAAGHEVILAREEDGGVTPGATGRQELYARVDMANAAGADLFFSVHNNGHDDRSLRGTEVYYCGGRTYAAENRRLATAVQGALVAALRRAGYETVDRGIHDDTEVYRGHMGVLGPRIARPTRMVAVLGESLFMTNDADAARLSQPEFRQAIALGYAEGIRAYLEGE